MAPASSAPVALNGSCCCQKIRFTSTTLPTVLSNCFCVQCRKITGGAYMTCAAFPTSSITWLSELPKYYRYSKIAKRGYCGDCGSTMTYEADDEPERINIAAGALDDWEVRGDIVKPHEYIFVEEKPVWYDIPNDGLQRLVGTGPTEASGDGK